MTEQLLDALRPLADDGHEHASRLVRTLKGSSAVEETAREHVIGGLAAFEALAATFGVASPYAVRLSVAKRERDQAIARADAAESALKEALTPKPEPEAARRGKGK